MFFIAHFLVYCLAILATVGGCKFGPYPDCVYPCHCMDGAVCDSSTGDCPAGCDDGDPNGYMWRGAWSGPGCQVGNVAYGRLATGANYLGYGTPAGWAVDGNRNPQHSTVSGSCAYARADNWIDLYWQVDLKSPYVIYNLTVYGTDGTANPGGHNYWINRVVEVGNEERKFTECGDLGDDKNALQVDVVCPQPLVGRYVRVRASSQDSGMEEPRLYMCEVFVIGYQFENCTDGAFGSGCLSDCHCRDQCDVISGHCSSQCEGGWVGSDCQRILPALRTKPTILEVKQNYLKFVFLSWEASPHSGDRPSSYVVEIRRAGTEDWQEQRVLSGLESGNITVSLQYDFNASATYEVRVIPILTYEGVFYQGYGIQTTFTLEAPLVGGTEAAAAAAETKSFVVAAVIVVVFLVIVITVVVIIIVLQRRGKLKTPRGRRLWDHGIMRWLSQRKDSQDVILSSNHAIEEDPPELVAACVGNLAYSSPEDETEAEPALKCEVSTTLPDLLQKNHSAEDSELNICNNEESVELSIKVQDLATHVQDMKNKPNGFNNEFMKIPFGQTAKWKTAVMTKNKDKNRYNNIMAYDHSRVTLGVSRDDPGQGYINANFVPGYKDVHQAYIAAQGPRVNTVEDMWRMIWQYKINRVVMVTRIMEEGKTKCEYYWPNPEDREQQEFGEFQVDLVKTETFADYIIRTFSVIYKDESRSVIQFHFVGWPDHGVPLVATSLLEFRRKVRAYDDHASGPLIVHCSAGVGRSGTFIALDYLLDQAKAEGEVDVFKFTSLMRNCRINMIQNLNQYIFVYDALLQGLLFDGTAVPSGQMAEVFPTLQQPDPTTKLSPLEKQFEDLEGLKPAKGDGGLAGLLPDNLHKNRNSEIIPSDKCRPFLAPRLEEHTDYINAAFINGYHRNKAFIVTQMPLPQTLSDFWQMLYDHKSPAIVLLHDFDHPDPEHEMCPRYWPAEVGDVMRLDALEVEMETEETIEDNIISRQFKITNTKNGEEEPMVVSQLHLAGWPSDVDTPEDPDRLVSLLEVMQGWQQISEDRTITVQCKTGAHQSGVLCAASYVLEKLKVDQEVDVFLAVAQTRLGRPEFIHSLAQYVFLHEIALKYIERNET